KQADASWCDQLVQAGNDFRQPVQSLLGARICDAQKNEILTIPSKAIAQTRTGFVMRFCRRVASRIDSVPDSAHGDMGESRLQFTRDSVCASDQKIRRCCVKLGPALRPDWKRVMHRHRKRHPMSANSRGFFGSDEMRMENICAKRKGEFVERTRAVPRCETGL